MLRIRNLHKEFGGIKAVDKCSFEVNEGEVVALIGPNGAGKTTVFNLITGYIKPNSGEILVNGSEILGKYPYQIASLGLKRTFQLIRLFPKMTVLENMMLAMPDHNEGLLSSMLMLPSMKKLEKDLIKKARESLEFVGLDVKVNELAGNLSYGQQKLLEIAKALASDPQILMLDEPAAGVNLTMLKKIKALMKELKSQGKTVLFIEHNMEFVMDIADKVVVLDYGKEIAYGIPSKIQKDKKVIDAYLGVVE